VRAEPSRLAAVSAKQVGLIPQCSECRAVWLPADEERWRAPGQTGPPGPANLTYVTETVAVGAGLSSTAYAECPAGMVVTGGGEFTDQFNTTGLNVTDSDWAPSTLNGPPTCWFATIHNGGANLLNFTGRRDLHAPDHNHSGANVS
jgi:hypothetical protein